MPSKDDYSAGSPANDFESADLAASCQNEFALPDLIARYGRLIFYIARRQGANEVLAQEIVQNVFLIYIKKNGSVPLRDLAAWFHRTALLESKNLVRKEQRYRDKLERFSDFVESDVGNLPARPDAAGDQLGIDDQLDEALNSLSTRDREVVMMRFFEGLSYKEIGGCVNASADSCQKRLSRALGRMRDVLTPTSGAIILTGGTLANSLDRCFGRTLTADQLDNVIAGVLANRSLAGTPPGGAWGSVGPLITLAILSLTFAFQVWVYHEKRSVDSASIDFEGPSLLPSNRTVSDRLLLDRLQSAVKAFEASPYLSSKLLDIVSIANQLPSPLMDDAYSILYSSRIAWNDPVIPFILGRHWASQDLDGVLIKTGPNLHRIEEFLTGVFSWWICVEPLEAYGALSKLPLSQRIVRAVKSNLMEHLVRADLNAAREVTEVFREYPHAVGDYWSKTDPDAAVEWMIQFFEDDLISIESFQWPLLRMIESGKYERTIVHAAKLGGSHEVSNYVGNAYAGWIKSDPEKALYHYLNELPDRIRANDGHVAEVIGWAMTVQDIEGAIPELRDRYLLGRHHALIKAMRWEESMETFSLITGEQEAASAAITTVRHGKAHEPEKLYDWIMMLEESDLRDRLLSTFCTSKPYEPVEENLELTFQINDLEIRRNASRTLFHYWYDSDPSAARTWLRNIREEGEDPGNVFVGF